VVDLISVGFMSLSKNDEKSKILQNNDKTKKTHHKSDQVKL
jgi:hypothetical protein